MRCWLTRPARGGHQAFCSAAVLSKIASISQFALVLGILDQRLLSPCLVLIGLGVLVTVTYGPLLLAPWRATSDAATAHQSEGDFSLWTALIFTLALTGIALFSVFLLQHQGHTV